MSFDQDRPDTIDAEMMIEAHSAMIERNRTPPAPYYVTLASARGAESMAWRRGLVVGAIAATSISAAIIAVVYVFGTWGGIQW